jgi:hypothetical protein
MNAIGLSPKGKNDLNSETVNFANMTAMGLLIPNGTKHFEKDVANRRGFGECFVFPAICRTTDKTAIVQMRRHRRVITSRGQME